MSDRWSESATKILICEYQRLEFLHNARHPDYKNRNKRLNAYKEIENVLQENGFQHTSGDVKKKLNGLRSQYLAEKLKIASSIKNGADVYKPTVYWYDRLKFLETCTAADESNSNLDVSTYLEFCVPSESNTEEMDMAAESPTATDTASTSGNRDESQRRNNKRKLSFNDTDSILYHASRTISEMTQIIKDNQFEREKLNRSNDSVDTFIQFIGEELRGIGDAGGDVLLRQVKRKIQQIILQSWDAIDYPSTNLSQCLLEEEIQQRKVAQNFPDTNTTI